MSVSNPELISLQNKILKERGFDCRQYREPYLKRRFAVRMRAWNVILYKEYATVLDEHPEEYVQLFDDLTINVTQFLRDQTVYEAFQNKVIPALVELKRQDASKVVRIWSCGCASGEEPYSIAICLYEKIGPKVSQYSLSIYGTDIDEISLIKARDGIYTKQSLVNVKSEIIDKYFEKIDQEKFRVKEFIRSMVRFVKHDFIIERPLVHLDIIFCRNVLIYLTKEMHTRLLINFYKSLNRKGFLVLGKVESLMTMNEGLFSNFNIRERIYQKT